MRRRAGRPQTPEPGGRALRAAAAGAAAVLALAGCTGADGAASASAGGAPGQPGASGADAALSVPAGAQELQRAYQQVIRQALPSVVEIRTPNGLGSGVVFDDQGNIVTNAHVVGDSTTFRVYLAGQAQPVAARLVGTYPAEDLAVIRLASPSGVRPATFAGSGEIRVGDLVLAMGNPLGLSSSVTDARPVGLAHTPGSRIRT